MDGKKETLTYSSYLKVQELIGLQRTVSEPAAHDEMLFIVVHQAYELWFKQVIFEMEALIQRLDADNLIPAFRGAARIQEIFRVLIQQVDILETMTPLEFNRFRSYINPGSGFQSFQFRELELLGGIEQKEMEKFYALEPEWKARLQARAARPSLREALYGVLERRGLLEERTPEKIRAALMRVYDENEGDIALQTLCENLIGFDEQVQLWRFRHVQMVERMIGMKPGTGGSLGVPYLQSTLRKRFFPELWEVRTGMGGLTRY